MVLAASFRAQHNTILPRPRAQKDEMLGCVLKPIEHQLVQLPWNHFLENRNENTCKRRKENLLLEFESTCRCMPSISVLTMPLSARHTHSVEKGKQGWMLK